mmetsp:Transcript_46309/g.100475  ORF Transcript_46309/g.100475 Transcript_46309/m.100475 type:complete len:203 (-) Transcript_46309:255-863(-)
MTISSCPSLSMSAMTGVQNTCASTSTCVEWLYGAFSGPSTPSMSNSADNAGSSEAIFLTISGKLFCCPNISYVDDRASSDSHPLIVCHAPSCSACNGASCSGSSCSASSWSWCVRASSSSSNSSSNRRRDADPCALSPDDADEADEADAADAPDAAADAPDACAGCSACESEPSLAIVESSSGSPNSSSSSWCPSFGCSLVL